MDHNLRDYLAEHRSGVNSLYPIEMMPHDPQSQVGLSKVLGLVRKFTLVGKTTGYKGLLMDISLYWSTLNYVNAFRSSNSSDQNHIYV